MLFATYSYHYYVSNTNPVNWVTTQFSIDYEHSPSYDLLKHVTDLREKLFTDLEREFDEERYISMLVCFTYINIQYFSKGCDRRKNKVPSRARKGIDCQRGTHAAFICLKEVFNVFKFRGL